MDCTSERTLQIAWVWWVFTWSLRSRVEALPLLLCKAQQSLTTPPNAHCCQSMKDHITIGQIGASSDSGKPSGQNFAVNCGNLGTAMRAATTFLFPLQSRQVWSWDWLMNLSVIGQDDLLPLRFCLDFQLQNLTSACSNHCHLSDPLLFRKKVASFSADSLADLLGSSSIVAFHDVLWYIDVYSNNILIIYVVMILQTEMVIRSKEVRRLAVWLQHGRGQGFWMWPDWTCFIKVHAG